MSKREIDEDDLKWLLSLAIRDTCVDNDEFGKPPKPETADRILRLMGDLEIKVSIDSDISWLRSRMKEKYT